MADENRLFFKLHSGFSEHPKTVGLSDKGFRHLIELWLYCHRNMTDGKVPTGQISRALTTKTRRELIEAGFLIEGEKSFEMHDYLKHQMSASDVETLTNRRKKAGALGGKARAKNLASAKAGAKQEPKQKGSKGVADIDVDKEKYLKESDSGKPNTRPKAKTPEHIATDAAYEQTGKAFNFIAVRSITKWMIHDRGLKPENATQTIVAVYSAGKPITKTTCGQYIDNIRNSNGKQTTTDRMRETMQLVQEMDYENNQQAQLGIEA